MVRDHAFIEGPVQNHDIPHTQLMEGPVQRIKLKLQLHNKHAQTPTKELDLLQSSSPNRSTP